MHNHLLLVVLYLIVWLAVTFLVAADLLYREKHYYHDPEMTFWVILRRSLLWPVIPVYLLWLLLSNIWQQFFKKTPPRD